MKSLEEHLHTVRAFSPEPVDKSYLDWTVSRQSSGIAGSFLKAYEIREGKKIYYKASNYDAVRGFYGHESLNEIVVCNLAEMLHINHLTYELVDGIVRVPGRENVRTLFTKSWDFKKPTEQKIAFETFYEMNRLDAEDVMTFIARLRLLEYFQEMFLLDWIVCNRDRHGANVEVLVTADGFRMAPTVRSWVIFCFLLL